MVILKPGSELLPLFWHGRRVLISDEPEHLKSAPAGRLPDVAQALALNADFTPFFTDAEVITAAGGRQAMLEAISRKNACQMGDSECTAQLTTLNYDCSAVRLCWYHDTKYTGHVMPRLSALATENTVEWVLDRIRIDLRLPAGHQLTVPEVFCWAVIKRVSDRLPERAAMSILNRAAEPITGEMKESTIRACDDRASVAIAEYVDIAREGWEMLPKPTIKIEADPEPPAAFMLRPKLKRWECEKYTKWVKTQPCAACGTGADDPHHIIGHGQGGMGTKAHDLFVIPLCRRCHDELHTGVTAWEQEHGSQIEHLYRFLDRALAIGAILKA
ncbi:DUF968 domain-containing protein [Leminorella grimontii]|uniref:DUF968 domain-containing protein n=1 Tax=Leminorella grimontii TaxID=82981 RepID=UPI00207EBB4A|nr:DUF968 domain-containing protein [Leminorella grimontii]GKX58364.1 hypothetical protein SOASR031_06790 [Leminorella grimontii]